ncbi:MAG: metalloregulator ArsR/SmtB family transcription factor [Desulfobulbaceae bacterium]|nr:metalloregulator ArsR/SmtB family transcription factor [Desulfobulbaceae bacterium]
MGDENRLRILSLISREKKSVSHLVDELKISQPLVSHHLKELKRALLVHVERSGPFVYYQVADQRIIDVLEILDQLAIDLLRNRSSF